MKWDIVELRRHAMNDQSQFSERLWNYTGSCSYCGGVKSFLDWLEAESRGWIDAGECYVSHEREQTEEHEKIPEVIDRTKLLEELNKYGIH